MKHENATTIVCGKCWRALPLRLRMRDRQLRSRQRRLFRLIEKRAARGTIDVVRINRLEDTYKLAFWHNWQRIRRYFREPERPIGLEGFLQEVGL